jgi:hypothetical protein
MIIQELRAEFNEYFQSIDPELILEYKTEGTLLKIDTYLFQVTNL